MKKLLVAASLSAVILTGCASIVSDSKYPVSVGSSPSSAHFVIKNENGRIIHEGRTPATITLNASNGYFDGADYTIIYDKDGFEPVTQTITSSVDGWYAGGNILFGGLIGWLVVDPATGAMWKLPAEDSATLPALSEGEVKMVSINQLDKNQKASLEKLN
ncbi:hypothetical protein BIZ37_00590 [Photobacterium sp. BZF1]|uniref:hypothetical protein n=1 Tax=Photobacterium sp. BZF1 TaxID=1904457 RepID=UPI001653D788|nr:hypothetical protein [Photobacterium sp. BZF1]MBC7001036.1 hypothetical protein [Photobacterium sp. BZF1]